MRATLFRVLMGVAATAGLVHSDPAVPFYKPSEAATAALADVKTQSNPQDLRYLWLGNSADPSARTDLISSCNFALNSLSKRKLLQAVVAVDANLLRVDLRHYGIAPSAWDELGAKGSGPVVSAGKTSCPEPYFHLLKRSTIQQFTERLVDVDRFQGADGKWYNQRWIKEPSGKATVKEELVHGPWLPAQTVRDLCLATQCDFPIMRADWFLANALIAPAYQRLLGIKYLKTFDEQVRFRSRDEDLAVKGSVLFSSEVAVHNRALLRSPTVFGYYWKSFDYQSSIADKDVLANILDNKADAHEIIASAPNGLQHYLIVDGANKVIDAGDPNIVIDRSTSWHNKLVWTGISCMTCHAKGLKEFRDEVRSIADVNKRIFALVRQEQLDRFTDMFGPKIDDFLITDQKHYAAAVNQITGLAPEKNAANLAGQFVAYLQKPITLDQSSLETGHPKATIIATLKKHTGLDHTLTQLLMTAVNEEQRKAIQVAKERAQAIQDVTDRLKAEAELEQQAQKVVDSPVRRDQFERSFGELMTILEHPE
jgi:hypothetical protein